MALRGGAVRCGAVRMRGRRPVRGKVDWIGLADAGLRLRLVQKHNGSKIDFLL